MNPKVLLHPEAEQPKVSITLRIDADVLEPFRALGAGWQTRINDALARVARGKASGEHEAEMKIVAEVPEAQPPSDLTTAPAEVHDHPA